MKALVLRPARSFIIDVITFLLIVLFVYAATSKILEFDEFRAQIGKSPIIMGHSSWISWTIPSLEIVISLAFLVPRLKLVAFYASYSLMLIFTMYIGFILTFSPYVPCSCGGILDKMGWEEHLVFNIVFTTLGAVGVFLHGRKESYYAGSHSDVLAQTY